MIEKQSPHLTKVITLIGSDGEIISIEKGIRGDKLESIDVEELEKDFSNFFHKTFLRVQGFSISNKNNPTSYNKYIAHSSNVFLYWGGLLGTTGGAYSLSGRIIINQVVNKGFGLFSALIGLLPYANDGLVNLKSGMNGYIDERIRQYSNITTNN